jgi:hypothetical protein
MGCGTSTSSGSVVEPVTIKARQQHAQSTENAQQKRGFAHGKLQTAPRPQSSGYGNTTAVGERGNGNIRAELSSRRFTHIYLIHLSVRKHKADVAARYAHSSGQPLRTYRSGEGEHVSGFPNGGLKALSLSTGTRRQQQPSQSLHAGRKPATTWWLTAGNDLTEVTEPRANSWLQNSYARHFGDKPPRLRPMLREARKAQARLAIAARQRASAMHASSRWSEAPTEILPDYDGHHDMHLAVGAN